MNNTELEQEKLDAFLERVREFLASDPYWMYVLTMPGGRTKRRQVAATFSKMMTTIPTVTKDNPFNRELRRKITLEDITRADAEDA